MTTFLCQHPDSAGHGIVRNGEAIGDSERETPAPKGGG
jgi:hypothetical protein